MFLYVNICVPVAGPIGLQAACAVLVALNRLYLRSHPEEPGIYDSGVRYLRDVEHANQETPRAELWVTIPDAKRAGGGDCKVLGAWRVAELQEQGEAAHCHVKRVSQTKWHIQVRREDGSIEDPSRELGMGEAA